MSVLAAVDLNWLLQFVVTVFLVAFGLLHVVKNTASKYFLAEDNDNDVVSEWSTPTTTTATATRNNSSSNQMMTTMTAAGTPGVAVEEDACAVCGNRTKKKCSGCKMVMYCSEHCQRSHWRSEHKKKCKDFRILSQSMLGGSRAFSAVSLGTLGESSKIIHQSKKILFPYEEFVKLFNWDKPGFPPCGLLNCGNSCFANVVLQCLAYTKPLVAFLLEKGHRRDCRRNDWCFLCEFQLHVQRASQSLHPFSPINILSRLPNIGGNLGYGKQEDAHEFMRFAIDTMQSVCLDEFGGEKAVHPTSQETTLIQHIFGGHLQSQVICTKCGNVSNQFENMMDLTVEIQGDAASLEECLDQFTAKEWLHGDNMYRCDGCNDYVMAWKRLSVRHAPNILTIALKRFQSGRFGKLNKRVTFPETLDLSPYMSEAGEENNIYKLYAVIVHVDMLNASFFGHYICYIKDFRGKWYRIDDCKVLSVDLDDVLSQGAYMLLYSRICARSSCLYPAESLKEGEENVEVEKEVGPSSEHPNQCCSAGESTDTLVDSVTSPSDYTSKAEVASSGVGLSCASNSGDAKEDLEMVDLKENMAVSKDDELCELSGSVAAEEAAAPFNHADSLVSGHNAPNTICLPLPPWSNVEDESGSRKGILQEYSLRHSSDQDSVATQSHFYKEGEVEPSAEHTVQRFSFRASTDTLVDSVVLPSDRTLNSEIGSCKAGLSSTSKSGYANEDLEMVGIKENFPFSMDEEAAAEHAHTIVSSNNASNAIDSKVDVLKTKPSSPPANVDDDIGGCKSIPKEYSFRYSSDHDPVAGQNHVYGREEMPLPVSAAVTICNEVVELSKAINSGDKTGRAGEMPSSNHVQGAARKKYGKCSGAKAKPLFPPGFLEQRPKNKNIKRENSASAEPSEQVSGSTPNSKNNGVSKPDLSCQIGSGMTNGNRPHVGHHDNGCASILSSNVGVHEKDTHMLTDGFDVSSGFDEPSRTGNGSSREPIILDDNTSVSNTDESMFVVE